MYFLDTSVIGFDLIMTFKMILLSISVIFHFIVYVSGILHLNSLGQLFYKCNYF